MKLIASYAKKLGYPPLFVDVGTIQFDILPFTLGFFEAVMLKEIECESEFNGYLRTCAELARDIFLDVGGITLTQKEIQHIETQIFCSIVRRSCKGVLAIA